MNPVISAQLNQFKETNSTESLSETDYFECYTIFSILNGYLAENTNPFEGHLKGTEFGIDGVCILIDGRPVTDLDQLEEFDLERREKSIDFVFIQSKSGESFDYGAISKFFDGVYGFFTDEMDGESAQLDSLIEIKNGIYQKSLRKNPNIKLFFVTTGAYTENTRMQTLVNDQKRKLESLNLFTDISIKLLGAKDLQESYRAATNSNKCEINFPNCQTLPTHPQVEQAYIGYIKASELLTLATRIENSSIEINSSVFFDNVRDFNPDSEVNKQILAEIKSGDRQGFVFRNNGVTVIARSLKRTGDKFAVDDYQIVNGCQTTNLVFAGKEYVNDLFVPFRLIESDNEHFVTSIILGTNTQNQVRTEQFWALRPFMKDLEEYCKQQDGDMRLFIERRENQYRSGTAERTRIVKPTDIMKAVAAIYLFQPHRAARDFRGIRAEYENKIFLKEHSVVPYHLALYADYKYEFLVRNQKIERSNRIFKYYVLSSVGYLYGRKQNMFSTNSKEQNRICDQIRSIISNEVAFWNHAQNVLNLLNTLIDDKASSQEGTSREKLRDTIRSEAFSKRFLEHVESLVI